MKNFSMIHRFRQTPKSEREPSLMDVKDLHWDHIPIQLVIYHLLKCTITEKNVLGIEIIRQHCAEYIQRRDGIPSDWQNIILSAGASGSIKAILALLRCPVDGKRPGVMVPTPQYPLYSATIAEFDMAQIGYYLDESKNWGLDINELQRSIDEARKTCSVRAIVIINPGNPYALYFL